MPSIFINDGLTLDATIEARPGLHPALRVKYRPALPEKVNGYLKELRLSGKAHTDAGVDLLAEHLVSWDAKDDAGNEVPISPRVLRRIYQPLLERLLDLVTTYSAPQREADLGN